MWEWPCWLLAQGRRALSLTRLPSLQLAPPLQHQVKQQHARASFCGLPGMAPGLDWLACVGALSVVKA